MKEEVVPASFLGCRCRGDDIGGSEESYNLLRLDRVAARMTISTSLLHCSNASLLRNIGAAFRMMTCGIDAHRLLNRLVLTAIGRWTVRQLIGSRPLRDDTPG